MEWFLQELFEHNGVKQGCPRSLSLFGLCINKLEEIIKKVAKEEKLDGPKLMHELIFTLLYADDAVLFSYSLDGMQHLTY